MKKQSIILLLIILSLLCGCGDSKQSIVTTPTPVPSGTNPVIFVSGGTLDDNVAYLLLSTMENIDLQGVIVTNTDCVASYAMQNQWRMAAYVNDTSLSVTLSESRAWNSFPWFYREDCIHQSKIEALAGYSNNSTWPPYPSGEDFLRETLSRAIKLNQPVTVLNTCPITMLRNVLEETPALEQGIKTVIMMGGAIDVPGNLDPDTIPEEIANPKAEWNFFCDPYAVDWIFKNTSFPMVLFPLDVTNEVPVAPEFMQSLKEQGQNYRYSELVYENYDLINDEPFFRMWNSLTSSYVAKPEFFQEAVLTNLSIVTEGYYQGSAERDSGGRPVYVVFDMADKEGFYSYTLNHFKRNYVEESSL